MNKESLGSSDPSLPQVEQQQNSIPEKVEKIIKSGSPKYQKGYKLIQSSWKNWSDRWGSKY